MLLTQRHTHRSLGIGMTNANMKLVALKVLLDDYPSSPKPKLEDGEHIVKRVIELNSLHQELKGTDSCLSFSDSQTEISLTAYEARGFAIDARLAHFASGWELAREFSKL